jgi:glc operon protein GlcG
VPGQGDPNQKLENSMLDKVVTSFLIGLSLCWPGVTSAQAQTPPPSYGPNITNEQAHKLVAGAMGEARKQGFLMAVAVVDTAGQLVMFERIDSTQVASIKVAQEKATSAATWKRPTKVFQDTLASGGVGLRVLSLPGAIPVEGGLPVVVDGKVIGAIGVSGGSADQDGMIAKAGLDAFAK